MKNHDLFKQYFDQNTCFLPKQPPLAKKVQPKLWFLGSAYLGFGLSAKILFRLPTIANDLNIVLHKL